MSTKVVQLDERRARPTRTLESYADGEAFRSVCYVAKDGVEAVGLLVPAGFDSDGVILTPEEARHVAILLIEFAAKAEGRAG